VSERPLRVVVVAEEAAGVQTLNGLASLRPVHEIVSVLTGDERRPVVREAARRLGLTTAPADLVRSAAFAEQLQDVDLLLNVHSLHIVHPDIVAAPRIGSFNLHPGPLPEYAGLNVPSWAIYNGEAAHGVTLHWMDDRIDAGPVAWLERFDLTDDDTGLSVAGQCIRRGVPLVLRLVETATTDADSIPRSSQDTSRRRYFGAGPPEDGRLDWSAAAAEISRFVRAADYAPFPSPWGHPRATLQGHEVGIAKVARTGVATAEPPGTVHELTDAGAVVATGDELLVVQRVQANGHYARPSELLRH
jgi:UDP-4-amino-4-deoxy-L-arabinose formyltransferase/UDP-glucuronic acid dehydrogenase (UDP-4-keto-hexauronic acid decarboxylating)